MNDTMMRVLEDGKKWALWGGCGSYEFGFELIDIGSPEPWSRGHRNSAAKRSRGTPRTPHAIHILRFYEVYDNPLNHLEDAVTAKTF